MILKRIGSQNFIQYMTGPVNDTTIHKSNSQSYPPRGMLIDPKELLLHLLTDFDYIVKEWDIFGFLILLLILNFALKSHNMLLFNISFQESFRGSVD